MGISDAIFFRLKVCLYFLKKFFRNHGIAKVLAVDRDVKPRNMNFAKVEKGGGGGGGRLLQQIRYIPRLWCMGISDAIFFYFPAII